ncbi:MAG: hypothetical protein WC603_01440 [Candidatus Paceibacterota bacterium]|jgi:hypothetical protein
MKTKMIIWSVILLLGLQAFRPPETESSQKTESYQRWVYFYKNDTTTEYLSSYVMSLQELADIVNSLESFDGSTKYQLNSGIYFVIPNPKLYYTYLRLCIIKADPSVSTTDDMVNAILGGEKVRWGNDIPYKVKNYWFSTSKNEVTFYGNFSGAEKGIWILLINGFPTVKLDCGNPLEVYGDGYVPTYTDAVKFPDSVITTTVNGETTTKTIFVVICLEKGECIPPQQVVYCERLCYNCPPTYSYDWCFNPIPFLLPFFIPMGGYGNNTRFCNSGGNVIDNSNYTYIDNSYTDNSYYNYEDNDVVINNPPVKPPDPPDDGSGIDPQDGAGIDPQGDEGKKAGVGGQSKSLNENQATAKTTTQPKQPTNEVTTKKMAPQTTTGGDLARVDQTAKTKTVVPSTKSNSNGGSLARVEETVKTKTVVPSAKSNSNGGSSTKVPETKTNGSATRQEIVPSQKQVKPGSELTRVESATGGSARKGETTVSPTTRQVPVTKPIVKNPSSKVAESVASARPTSEGGSATRKVYTQPSPNPSTQASQRSSNQNYSQPSNSRESYSSPNRKPSQSYTGGSANHSGSTSYSAPSKKPSQSYTGGKQTNPSTSPSRSYSKPPSRSYTSGSSGGGKSRYNSGTPNGGYSGGGAQRSGGAPSMSGRSSGGSRPH